MEYIIFFLIFLTGIFGGILYYKSRLKKWSHQLNDQIDAMGGSVPVPVDEKFNQMPEELSALTSKFKSVLDKQLESTNSGVTEKPQDENVTSLRKLIDNLYIVNELGRKVTSSLNLQMTFHHLYTTINSMMDAAALELMVYDELTGERKIFSNLEVSGGSDSNKNHMAEWSFKNNREIFLSDAEHDFGRYVFQPLVLPGDKVAGSVMVFPITSGGKVSGTLSVISFQKNSFDAYHQEIIRMLLGYISVAIENAITHDELNSTKIRAEQSEKFKEQFLANMSHEIRTPINAVTGMTRLLLEKTPREDQLRYLESIRNASDSLLVIINDILDLSKIEAGKIELERIDFSVHEVIKNVREIMNFKAEDKGLRFVINSNPGIPDVFIGDPTRLSQILINLLGNAIKFTDKGSIELAVKLDGITEKNCAALTFDISDTGIGMTEEQQSRLFKDYSQASSETSRTYGGTGLGLSISRQLVELQGGDISVKSAPGKGSTFTFSLKYPISNNKPIAINEQKISSEMIDALKGIRVLIADDNEYNRIVVKETLQMKIGDVHIDEAHDGNMVLELFQNNHYDVILMDLVMPIKDGLETTRIIRNTLEAPKNRVFVIALTASVIKSEIDKCIEVGMNGFIPKPFKPLELISTIYNVMHGSNPFRTEIPVINQKIFPHVNGTIDLNCLDEFTEGDPVRRKRFMDLFLKNIPASIQSVQEALNNSDYEKIRIVSHSMKPQLRAIGVLKGLELAETIEQSCNEKSDLDKLPYLVEQLVVVCKQAIDELKKVA